jgi:hypothetical protein
LTSSFNAGVYLVWNVSGHVKARVTLTGGANAVMSGFFFAPTSGPGAATFVNQDTTTQGNWRGVYGANGYNVISDQALNPAYVTPAPTGQTQFVWMPSTSDVRALQKASNPADRIAGGWYSYTTFTVDLPITDGNTHQLALYFLDWDTTARRQRVDILDGNGNVLSTQSLTSSFHNGVYLVWNVSGHVKARVTLTGGDNAVISGLFFATGSVTNPVYITTFATLQNGTVASPYSQTLNAVGGTPPYSWSVISGTLPTGLGLNSSTGTISGTPYSSNGYVFTVQVRDAAQHTSSNTFGLTIYPPSAALRITTTSPLPGGTSGAFYSDTILAWGGTSPYTWSKTSGTLPAGVTFLGGVLSGTPTSTGTWTFGVQVNDTASHSATASFNVTISAPTNPVAIGTPSPLTSGPVGLAYVQSFSATGGTQPYTWTVTSGTTPPGLALSSGGVLTGTPTTSGTYNFTVQVTDGGTHTPPAKASA